MNVIKLDAAPATQSFDYTNIIFFALLIIVFYYFNIRPQKKKREQHKNYLANLKKGDAIVTVGGLCGKVHSVDGDKIVIEVDDHGRKLTILKSAVLSEVFYQQSEKK